MFVKKTTIHSHIIVTCPENKPYYDSSDGKTETESEEKDCL